MEEKNINTSVVFKTKDKHSTYKFTPTVTLDNSYEHLANIMTNFGNAVLHLSYLMLPMLRAASKEERDLHAYIYKSDDVKDEEHILYKARNQLYISMKDFFNAILTQAFPDIIYIDNCQDYQQRLSFEESDDLPDVKEYVSDVEKLTKLIRDNYSSIQSETNKAASLGEKPEPISVEAVLAKVYKDNKEEK